MKWSEFLRKTASHGCSLSHKEARHLVFQLRDALTSPKARVERMKRLESQERVAALSEASALADFHGNLDPFFRTGPAGVGLTKLACEASCRRYSPICYRAITDEAAVRLQTRKIRKSLKVGYSDYVGALGGLLGLDRAKSEKTLWPFVKMHAGFHPGFLHLQDSVLRIVREAGMGG